MKREFTVVVERGEDGYLIGTVPGLHGAHSQGKDLDELMRNMREVIELCLDESDGVPGLSCALSRQVLSSSGCRLSTGHHIE